MGILEEFMAFAFVMSIVSIPIIAILKRKPKGESPKILELENRIKDLELKVLDRNNELYEIKNELTFMQKLLEHKRD